MPFIALQIGGGTTRTEIKTIDGAGTDNSSVGTIIIDALEDEDFNADADITQHPIENGADSTDAVIIKPKRVTIKGIVTITPFTYAALFSGLAASAASKVGANLGSSLSGVSKTIGGSLGGALGGAAGGLVGKSLAGLVGDNERELSDVVNAFVAIRDSKKLVNIQTGLQLYKGYILHKVNVKRNKTTGGSIIVSLTLQEFLFATSETVDVDIAIPRNKNALAEKNKGLKSATETSDGVYRSWAKSLSAASFGGG